MHSYTQTNTSPTTQPKDIILKMGKSACIQNVIHFSCSRTTLRAFFFTLLSSYDTRALCASFHFFSLLIFVFISFDVELSCSIFIFILLLSCTRCVVSLQLLLLLQMMFAYYSQCVLKYYFSLGFSNVRHHECVCACALCHIVCSFVRSFIALVNFSFGRFVLI